ncbi:hypothetical protein ESCO_002372 [Escovopsis weberi]|uniref:Uncharacterized protein n=1 Tax=Escovopsis weberi TaxID=150374 RepID=A0A0M8N7X7_ESCWE|nr:hypothetical protein ESCO_002372 [Escovopsis weberi]
MGSAVSIAVSRDRAVRGRVGVRRDHVGVIRGTIGVEEACFGDAALASLAADGRVIPEGGPGADAVLRSRAAGGPSRRGGYMRSGISPDPLAPEHTPASDHGHAVPVTPLSSVQGMPGPAGYYAPTPPAQPYETPHMHPMPTPSPQPLVQGPAQPPPPQQQQHLMQYQPGPVPGQSPPPAYLYYNSMAPGAQPLSAAAPPPAQYYYPPQPQPQPQPGWPPQPYPYPAQPAFAATRDDFVPALPPRPHPVTVFAGQPAPSWTGGHGPPGGMYAAPPPMAYAPQPYEHGPPQPPRPLAPPNPSSSSSSPLPPSSSPSKKLFSTATARRWLDKTSALLENKLDSVLQGSTGQWPPPQPVYQYMPPAQAPPGPQGYPGPQPYPYYGAPGQGGVPYQRYA